MGYIGKVPADVLIDPHVDSAAITDGTIITADIANDAVTSAKLAENSVDSSELIDGSVDNSHLAGSIAVNKTLLTAGTGLTLSTNTLSVDAAQTQITSVGTLSSLSVSGQIGIGVSPNAPLQFSNDADTRKIVLYEGANNDYQFYGFGIEGSTLVYSTYTTSDDHVFFAGTGTSSRNELARITGGGTLKVKTSTFSTNIAEFLNPSGTTLVGAYCTGNPGSGQFYIKAAGGTTEVLLNSIGDSYLTGGSLGIGVTSPAYALDVRTSSGTASLQVRAPNDANARIRLIADNQDDNADNFQIIHTASDNDIEFQRWNGSAWRSDLIIDSSGNVGISNTNPQALLHVGSGTDTPFISATALVSNAGTTNLAIRNATSNIELLNYIDSAQGIIGCATNHPLIIRTNNANRITLANDGEFLFETARSGLSGAFVNDNGSTPYGIKIDFDSATPNNNTSYFITCQDSTNDKFIVYSDGDVQSRTNSYTGISDERLKENIVDATPKLDELNQVRVVNYNFIDEPDKKQLGVVAQELQGIFPKMVSEYGEDGYLGVKYSIFVPMLIKALQEADDKIDALTARIESLENT